MYDWSIWLDHVTDPANVFSVVDNGDNTYTITPAGTVMQQGTAQDQTHFNNMEMGILNAQAAAALSLIKVNQQDWRIDDLQSETDINLRGTIATILNYARQQAWEVERGSVALTNTADNWLFNNSQTTVSLTTKRESTDYIILTEVASTDGNVGEIEISGKLLNGFKIKFTGSASAVTVNYIVIGGFMK